MANKVSETQQELQIVEQKVAKVSREDKRAVQSTTLRANLRRRKAQARSRQESRQEISSSNISILLSRVTERDEVMGDDSLCL